jgi:TPP-dependent pyruvate/acetoin dehydrogenase alpha subunit
MAKTLDRKSESFGGLGKETLGDFLRQMYEIRFFEEKVADLLKLGVIKGASHLYAGEEAVAVGAISTITEDDVIASTHRGHGHCGAIGVKHAHTEAERQTTGTR